MHMDAASNELICFLVWSLGKKRQIGKMTQKNISAKAAWRWTQREYRYTPEYKQARADR